jgi:hypothetical protein
MEDAIVYIEDGFDCLAFTETLASTLAAAAPPGVAVDADPPGYIMIWSGETNWIVVSVCEIAEQEGDLRGHLEAACFSVLSSFQDVVVHELRDEWPRMTATATDTSSRLPLPQVRILDQQIELWFGTETHRVVSLGPIQYRTGT